MTTVYKIWIEIEEYDVERGDGRTIDAPGSSVATFATEQEAYEFAKRLNEAGDCLALNYKTVTHE